MRVNICACGSNALQCDSASEGKHIQAVVIVPNSRSSATIDHCYAFGHLFLYANRGITLACRTTGTTQSNRIPRPQF